MFKKILLAAILATSSTVVLANPAPYLGGSLGFVTNTSNNLGSSNAANYYGFPVNLFAGYGGVVSQSFYLAGELTGTVGTFSGSSSSNTLKTTYGYGVSILPGVMLSDHTLAFARAGVVRTRFSHAANGTGSSNNKSVTGGQFGLGVQTTLTQNLSLRGEYDFTAYRSFNNIHNPRSGEASLGLVYSFE